MDPKAKEYQAVSIVTTPMRLPLSRREKEAIKLYQQTGCIGALNSAGLFMQSNNRLVRKEVVSVK